MQPAGEPGARRMQSPGPLAGSPPPQRLPRPRKKRTVYLREQRQELEKYFTMNRYPNYGDRLALAAKLHLDEQQIQVWFKNRRAKHARPRPPPGLPVGRSRRARTAPRGPGRPAPDSVPAPVPAPHPPSVLVPGRPMFPGTVGDYSLPQAWWDPKQGYQGQVPTAQAPVPAPDLAWPQNSFTSDFSPHPALSPNFTVLLSPQDSLEEPSFPLASGSQEGDDSAEDLRRLLDL